MEDFWSSKNIKKGSWTNGYYVCNFASHEKLEEENIKLKEDLAEALRINAVYSKLLCDLLINSSEEENEDEESDSLDDGYSCECCWCLHRT